MKKKPVPHLKFENSRKTIRKQKRQQKKIHRQEHYLKKKTPQQSIIHPQHTPGRFVKRPADGQDTTEMKKKRKKPNAPSYDILNKERQKEINEADQLKSEMEEQRRKILLKANEEEDRLIKKLEKQMGLNKSKNKNNYFSEDGLDYLLEICDRSTTEQIVAAEKHLAEVDGDSDFEEDIAIVTGKDKHQKKSQEVDPHNSDEKFDNSEESCAEEAEDGLSDEYDDLDDDYDGTDSELEEKPKISSKNKTDKKKINERTVKEESSNVSSEDEKSYLSSDSDESDLNDEPEGKQIKKTKEEKKERIIKADDISKVFSDDEISHLSSDDIDDENVEPNEKPDIWEDIYGRKRDKDGNVIKEQKGTYIPPHLRNKDVALEKDLTQLKRQIKSVLNKLAGTNLHWACTSIENLYGNNSRHAVNTSLSDLWLHATVAPPAPNPALPAPAAPARLVAEHAALVAVLHANVGSEIGAHFLQVLCKEFDRAMQTPQPVEDKRLDNLVSCLSYLYTFKVYHAALLYDVLARLLADVTEKGIECVLVALRAVGGVLRKEEPLALKNFIHETQERVTRLSEDAARGSRIKFLLEVLMAVKNNNLTKIPQYDPAYAEHLRKSIKGIIRKGNYVTTLNIRLEDLLKADERGKWWVVGSAWEGGARQGEARREDARPPPSVDQKLLELARKQRMNTDVRRSIFCVIMSAEDYMDAFEKLQHLGLRGQQEREVAHVLLACCLQETTYNPYYGVLGRKLCEFDRKYQLSIQFTVWDKIKDIENQSKQALTNLAQFLVHLIMEKGLALSVLKIIQFSELSKQSVRFMRQVLLSIIMNEDVASSLEVFQRVARPPKLHVFRESLRLFIQHFLVKTAGRSGALGPHDAAALALRAADVDAILTRHESKLKL
ncbi:nucleolar MIF4G domain-containing protein 1 homolog [Bombyx mandarina]|uniref:Nucleolar MIF4G domain-containing protein 1 homolog n=1 Tax=Bombyx mandarina TaxID=7092 RepID=A0A6J2JIB8_BOMMA|nr:nucleolar MIF4G domain-containing protein 1 homolog [Bombyx mandarina]